MENLIYIIPAFGIIALVYMFILSKWVSKQSAGSEKMQSIANAIADGAMSFLKAEYRVLAIFVVLAGNLIAGLSALDNVMLPAYPLGLPHRRLVERAREVMAQLSVGHRAEARVELLSGGEMQRVAIARALINDPEVLIADEPTANLDGRLAGQFLEIVAALKAQGRTLVIASHDPRIIEAPTVDRVVRMADGAVQGVRRC
jgi:putative ABC transport system ATP-binding protein